MFIDCNTKYEWTILQSIIIYSNQLQLGESIQLMFIDSLQPSTIS